MPSINNLFEFCLARWKGNGYKTNKIISDGIDFQIRFIHNLCQIALQWEGGGLANSDFI